MGGIRDAACPIFTGYGDGTFRPNMPISREEAAAINQPSAETARQCDGCEHVHGTKRYRVAVDYYAYSINK
ncbi:S-layer homology domain-containing protein [Paenibacillus azoreducens]|uniref:S-layer homology domain-containing protein n=1 Tax=Paenibacillus azoreducens TaxID=116718 RepID=UPI0039F480A4